MTMPRREEGGGGEEMALLEQFCLPYRVSDAGIRYLIEGLSGYLLKELNVTNCAKISDVTLLRISQQ